MDAASESLTKSKLPDDDVKVEHFCSFFNDSEEVIKLFHSEIKPLLKENEMYKTMNKFLEVYKIWQNDRKQFLLKAEEAANSIERLKENASLAKFLLSSTSVFGSAIFLVTDYLNIKSDYKLKLLTISGLIGSLSFFCDVISQYYSKLKMEQMIHLFLLDQDNFEILNSDRQYKVMYDLVEQCFPCGINTDILMEVLSSQRGTPEKLRYKIKELDRRCQILKQQPHYRFEYIRRSRSIPYGNFQMQSKISDNNRSFFQGLLHEREKQLMMYKMNNLYLNNSSQVSDQKSNVREIFSVIYLSNVSQNFELLKDSRFIERVKIFSKSTFANLWWKNLENKKSPKQTEKKRLYSEMKSVLKMDKLFWPAMSVAALPLSTNNTMNALAIIVTSSIIAFDAFCELTIRIQPKETSILRRLHRILSAEYADLKLNSNCANSESIVASVDKQLYRIK